MGAVPDFNKYWHLIRYQGEEPVDSQIWQNIFDIKQLNSCRFTNVNNYDISPIKFVMPITLKLTNSPKRNAGLPWPGRAVLPHINVHFWKVHLYPSWAWSRSAWTIASWSQHSGICTNKSVTSNWLTVSGTQNVIVRYKPRPSVSSMSSSSGTFLLLISVSLSEDRSLRL